jgi:hypothetical protein
MIDRMEIEPQTQVPLAVKTLASRMSVPLVGAVLLLGLYVYYDLVVYRDYLARGDDPAFISATQEFSTSWFTRGYLNYFHIYPEWPNSNATQLLKPMTNVVGYLNYSLFGSLYRLHFAVFFLMQFVGLLVFVRLLRELAVPPLPAAGMALLFLFNPAFMNDGLVALPSHFDVLAGAFALIAFLTAWRERYGVALLALTLAVFTKESALFAPLAAALSLLIWRRPLSVTALMLLPLPLWAAARFLAYGDVFDTGGTAQPGQIAMGLSIWPTGLVTVAFVSQLGSSLVFGRPEIVSAVFLAANIVLWVLLGYVALAAMRLQVDAPERAKLTTALLVWTLGALAFGVTAGYAARYGGSIYPFLYLFVAGLFFSPGYRVPRWVVASVLILFSAATVVQGARNVRLAFAWQSIIAPERALHDALKALPQDGRTVFVVNAPPAMASAPGHLRRAWSLNVDVVIVNQFRDCTSAADGGSTQVLDSAADVVSVRIPECAVFDFRNAVLSAQNAGTGIVLQRDGVGTYTFSGGSTSGPGTLELGRTLTLRIDPKRTDGTLLGYNWKSATYDVISGL